MKTLPVVCFERISNYVQKSPLNMGGQFDYPFFVQKSITINSNRCFHIITFNSWIFALGKEFARTGKNSYLKQLQNAISGEVDSS
jgi:hypothetical protein